MAQVAQIASGQSFDRSAEGGSLSTTRKKTFRILRAYPDERVNFESLCKIRIGSRDNENPALRCVSWSAQFDGDSRMALIVTFTYMFRPHVADSENDNGVPYVPPAPAPVDPITGIEENFPPPDDGNALTKPPDIRPANWHIQSSLIEVPVYSWLSITGPYAGTVTAPINSAGDLYEGVTKLEPVVSIHVEQFMWPDPTANAMHVGKVNKEQWTLGQMVMPPRSVMLRAMNTQPAVEDYGGNLYRGWTATYEFLYRRNYVGGSIDDFIGWDWAQPQAGFNQQLPFGAANKLRCMIDLDSNGNQVPCAQPVPLNDDGTMRAKDAVPTVLVHRHQIYEELDFDILNVRLG